MSQVDHESSSKNPGSPLNDHQLIIQIDIYYTRVAITYYENSYFQHILLFATLHCIYVCISDILIDSILFRHYGIEIWFRLLDFSKATP